MAERGISHFPNLTKYEEFVEVNPIGHETTTLLSTTKEIETMKCVLIFVVLVQVTLAFSAHKFSFTSIERCQSQGCHAKMESITSISMSMSKEGDDFWESQKKLAASIADSVDQEEKEIRL